MITVSPTIMPHLGHDSSCPSSSETISQKGKIKSEKHTTATIQQQPTMSLPNLGDIQVQNNTVHSRSSSSSANDISSPSTSNTSTSGGPDRNIDGRDRHNATIRTGYIAKYHIFPKHKFITKHDDLMYDTHCGSFCGTYLDALELLDSKNKAHKRKLWDVARNYIPMALNGQRNNTSKAIRDITFDSKSCNGIICIALFCLSTNTCLSK